MKPRTFWSITQGWKSTREPSPAYFLFSRVGTSHPTERITSLPCPHIRLP
ncbi:DUF6199 family natural product biosynthesis protein [Paenibacillus spiritus]